MNKKILVVDDNPINQEILVKQLQKRGFDVQGVSTGEECINHVLHHHVDLILLDVIMPGISGLGVLENLRQTKKPVDLPIIMVTSKDEDEDIVKALRLGANDYLVKPVNVEVAMARIETQINLQKFHKERLKIKEIEAVNAMIITYNHEINSPLSIISATLARTKHQDPSLTLAKTASDKITQILKKIEKLTSQSIQYTDYSKTAKMIHLKKNES